MISVSILDSNLLNIEKSLTELKNNNINHLHLDILDTSLVPNISFGPNIINQILKYDFIFDVHLMVKDPITILQLLDLEKIGIVFIHYEINNMLHVVEFLVKNNKKIGLTISPNISVKTIFSLPERILQNVNTILIMTVYPGFGNQKFINECAEKIKMIDKKRYSVAVDGGISINTIRNVKGYDKIVIGSAYFKAENKKVFLNEIEEILKK